MKGAFSNEWHTIIGEFNHNPDSPLTTKVITLPPPDYGAYEGNYFPLEGQADFQVQAREWTQVPPNGPLGTWVITLCAESGWSNTKTVNFGQGLTDGTQNQPNHTPSRTSTDQTGPQPELTIIQLPLTEFILVIILCTTLPVLIIALIYTRKTSRHKQDTQT